MPDALPPAAVEAGTDAMARMYHGSVPIQGTTRKIYMDEVHAVLTAALPHLRAQWEGEIKAAFCEGYDTGSDPAWCEKQLRRVGVKAETWEPAATDYFWQGSEAAAALRAPTTSYPLTQEAQLSTDSLSEPTAPSGEAP